MTTGEGDWVIIGDKVGAGVCEADGLGDSVGAGVAIGLAEGSVDWLGVLVGVGEFVGIGEAVGDAIGDAVGDGVGEAVGVGARVGVGVGVPAPFIRAASAIPNRVAFAATVELVIVESHLEVPLFGGESKSSAAEELYTMRFFVQPPAAMISAFDGLTVTSVPLFLEIIVIA